jgi:hypothetical protein
MLTDEAFDPGVDRGAGHPSHAGGNGQHDLATIMNSESDPSRTRRSANRIRDSAGIMSNIFYLIHFFYALIFYSMASVVKPSSAFLYPL